MKKDSKYEVETNKVLNNIGKVLCILLLPVLIFVLVLFSSTILEPDQPPQAFGYTPMVVDSGSMSPTFGVGDLAVVKQVTTEEAYDLEVGDIVCYFNGPVYVIHRIIAIENEGTEAQMYVTQDDANNEPDAIRVSPSQIFGVFAKNFEGIGYTVLWMQTPIGVVCCVAIPLLLVFGYFYWWDHRRYKQIAQAIAADEAAAQNTEAAPASPMDKLGQ